MREAFAGGSAVAALGTSLGGGDGQDGADQALPQFTQGALALTIVQRGRRAQIQAQLNPRIRRVDALTAGTRRVGEALFQLPCRYDEAVRAAGPSGNAQIVHAL